MLLAEEDITYVVALVAVIAAVITGAVISVKRDMKEKDDDKRDGEQKAEQLLARFEKIEEWASRIDVESVSKADHNELLQQIGEKAAALRKAERWISSNKHVYLPDAVVTQLRDRHEDASDALDILKTTLCGED